MVNRIYQRLSSEVLEETQTKNTRQLPQRSAERKPRSVEDVYIYLISEQFFVQYPVGTFGDRASMINLQLPSLFLVVVGGLVAFVVAGYR
jgi:hypothetical protein